MLALTVALVVSIAANLAQFSALSFYKGYYDQKQRNRKLLFPFDKR